MFKKAALILLNTVILWVFLEIFFAFVPWKYRRADLWQQNYAQEIFSPFEVKAFPNKFNDVCPPRPPREELSHSRECIGKEKRSVFDSMTPIFMPPPDSQCEFIAKHHDKVIFDARVSIDHYSRRVIPERPARADKHLIVFGGSYTWGEGVSDEETLPNRLNHELGKEVAVYSMSYRGYGPNDLLARIHNTSFLKGVPQKDGAAIYIFIPNHFMRAIGRMSVIGNWGPYLSSFDYDDHHLRYRGGSYGKTQPLLTLFYQILWRSRVIRAFNVDLPVLQEKHYDKFVAFISEMKREYLKRFNPKNEFYFVFYPEPIDKFDRNLLRKKLSEARIHFLDYSPVPLCRYSSKALRIPYDGHPNALAHQLMARRIVEDLHLKEILKIQSTDVADAGKDE